VCVCVACRPVWVVFDPPYDVRACAWVASGNSRDLYPPLDKRSAVQLLEQFQWVGVDVTLNAPQRALYVLRYQQTSLFSVVLSSVQECTDRRYCFFSLEGRGSTFLSLGGCAAPGRLRAPPLLLRFAREGRHLALIRCPPTYYLRSLPDFFFFFFFAVVELPRVPAGTPHRPHPPRPPCPVAPAGSAAGSASGSAAGSASGPASGSASSGVDPPPWTRLQV